MANALRILNRTILSRKCSTQAQPALNLTESCIKRIKSIQDEKTYLRLAVDSGGCSGFQYKFELDSNELAENDYKIEKEGARLVIDSTSLDLIRGSVIDYREELIRSAFRVNSIPRAQYGCSCGTSFSVQL